MKIQDKSPLSLQYIPNTLPFRQQEIETIKNYLLSLDRGENIPNIIIYGPTGSGKTSVVKYITKHIDLKNTDIVYMNARFYNSFYRVISKLVDEEERIGFPISLLLAKLKDRKRNLVAIIDEADFVRDIDDLLYTLSRSNEESEAKIHFILITNSIQLKSRLDARTLSSLNEIEMFFSPYTAQQLLAILRDRVDITIPGQYREESIAKIAAVAASESGDARYAIKVLARAIEIAEREQAEMLLLDHVDRAFEVIELDIISETLKSLPINLQIVMYTIAKMYSNRQKDLFQSEDLIISISEAYTNYSKISETVFRRKPKGLKWFRHYLNELENLGLVSSVAMKSKNREILSYVRLGVNHKDILKYFEKYYGIK
ncbi:MAG: AAA family ATPase [Candidatus Micrarchaeota archaeon]|nr:AAA family ATPase [Candidatus Micrarchaeota archaeon]MCX8154501.1 AAA family ATPase [Candidatus Micrarchaeota archaeon]